MSEFPEYRGIIPFLLTAYPEIASLQWVKRLLDEGYPPEVGFFFYLSRFVESSITAYKGDKVSYVAAFSDICEKAVNASANPSEIINGITPIHFVDNIFFTGKQKNQEARRELKALLVKGLTDVGGCWYSS